MNAVVARFLKKVVRVREVGSQKWHFAAVANDGVGFHELGIDADAFIKNTTFALIVVASDLTHPQYIYEKSCHYCFHGKPQGRGNTKAT